MNNNALTCRLFGRLVRNCNWLEYRVLAFIYWKHFDDWNNGAAEVLGEALNGRS